MAEKAMGDPLLKDDKLPRDILGASYFVKFYGFDRLWLLAYVVSALATPAIRFLDEEREGPGRRYDFFLFADFILCMLSLVLLLSIAWAVDSPAFVRMHRQHGRQPWAFWVLALKGLAAVNVLRVLAPLLTGDSRFAGFSHVGGVFQVSAVIFTLPFAVGIFQMTTNSARSVVGDIKEGPEEGKWPRVLGSLRTLRSDMIQLWSLRSAGLPWCVTIAAGVYGAYFNGVFFLETKEPQRALFFFAYIAGVLAVLYPLSVITTVCNKQIARAASAWYPLDAREALPAAVFQPYTLVLDSLDRKFIGASLLGVPITEALLRDWALKALLGLPALYHALATVAGRGTVA